MTGFLKAFEEDIISDLEIIQVVAHDVEETNELINTSSDPELAMMYRESLIHSIDIYKRLGTDVRNKLENHIKYCNDNDIPINVNFFRVLKVLKNASVE